MSEPNPPAADAGAVKALLAVAQDALTDERTRGKDLDAKTGSLAAFSGTILALDVAFGKDILEKHLGSAGNLLVPGAFVCAAVLLLAAAVIAVAGVMRPQSYMGIDTEEIKGMGSSPLLATDKTNVEGTMLATIGDVLTTNTERNDGKAKLVGISALALAAGLGAIAVQAVAFGLHALGA